MKHKKPSTEDRIVFTAVIAIHLFMVVGGLALAVLNVLAGLSFGFVILWLSVSAIGLGGAKMWWRMYARLNSDKTSRQRTTRRR